MKLGWWKEGYTQKDDIHCNELFSQVVQQFSILILLVLIVQFELELDLMDDNATFLLGDLKEIIFTTQLDSFKVVRKENIVYKLKKSSYFLKLYLG